MITTMKRQLAKPGRIMTLCDAESLIYLANRILYLIVCKLSALGSWCHCESGGPRFLLGFSHDILMSCPQNTTQSDSLGFRRTDFIQTMFVLRICGPPAGAEELWEPTFNSFYFTLPSPKMQYDDISVNQKLNSELYGIQAKKYK